MSEPRRYLFQGCFMEAADSVVGCFGTIVFLIFAIFAFQFCFGSC